jgi:hypothetical protein
MMEEEERRTEKKREESHLLYSLRFLRALCDSTVNWNF